MGRARKSPPLFFVSKRSPRSRPRTAAARSNDAPWTALAVLTLMNLVLQAGGFGLVVLDLADVAPRTVRSLPFTTWFRLARVIEGSDTVALLVAGEHDYR